MNSSMAASSTDIKSSPLQEETSSQQTQSVDSRESDPPHITPTLIGMSDEEDSQKVDEDGKTKDKGGKNKKGVFKVAPYRDYSWASPENKEKAAFLSGGIPRAVGNAVPTSAKEPTFPVKLHSILSNREYEDIISWLPHGRSWRIVQQQAFKEKVIPIFFRHGRYSSFARQGKKFPISVLLLRTYRKVMLKTFGLCLIAVNGWGFKRISHGSDFNSYYHELFLRGMPHLCVRMRRLTAKDIKDKKDRDDEKAPNFYAISRQHPLPDVDGMAMSNDNSNKTTADEQATSKRRLGQSTEGEGPVGSQSQNSSLSQKRDPVSEVLRMNAASTSKFGATTPTALSAASLPPNAATSASSLMQMVQLELASLERQRREILQRLEAIDRVSGLGPAAKLALQGKNGATAGSKAGANGEDEANTVAGALARAKPLALAGQNSSNTGSHQFSPLTETLLARRLLSGRNDAYRSGLGFLPSYK